MVGGYGHRRSFFLEPELTMNFCIPIYVRVCVCVCVCVFVGSCLATKVFTGNLPAMGRGWVIIK